MGKHVRDPMGKPLHKPDERCVKLWYKKLASTGRPALLMTYREKEGTYTAGLDDHWKAVFPDFAAADAIKKLSE